MKKRILCLFLAVILAVLPGCLSEPEGSMLPIYEADDDKKFEDVTEAVETEPSGEATEAPTAQEQTEPTEAPTEAATETANTEAVQQAEDLLEELGLAETEKPVAIYDPELDASGKLHSLKEDSKGFNVAQTCSKLPANPVAFFYLEVNEGTFKRTATEKSAFTVALTDPDYESYDFRIQEAPAAAGRYAYTQSGCQELMKEIMMLSGANYDYLDLEAQILANGDASGRPVIHYSKADKCYYGYYIYYGDITSYILCVYIRSANGNTITDVEFQMMSMEYYMGGEMGSWYPSGRIAVSEKFQIASLIAATERLLTGQTIFNKLISADDLDAEELKVNIPLEYTLGEYEASISRRTYSREISSDEETQEVVYLTGYRIRR